MFFGYDCHGGGPLAQPKDLGFTSKPTTTELFARAKERGLGLCPAEVGVHLRLALREQPFDDWFCVAMEPIIGSDDYPCVFNIERVRDDEQRLDARYAEPYDLWDLELEIVFLQSKPGT